MLDEALEAAKIIPDYFKKNKALIKISNRFFEWGDTGKALEVLNEALNQISRLAVISIKLLNRALEVARIIPDYFQKNEVLLRIFHQFLPLRDKGKAREVLNEALEAAKAIPDDLTRNEALVKISDRFFELGILIKL